MTVDNATATWIRCAVCDKDKAPIGRSVAVAMADSFCNDECVGYRLDPKPDCRWPGEEQCGPGCTK